MRRLFTGLLVAALLLVGGAPVLAATPMPGTVLHFDGTMQVTDLEESSTFDGVYPVSIDIDCSTGECLITGTSVSDGVTVLIVGAVPTVVTPAGGSFPQPAAGDVCSNTEGWIEAGDFVVSFSDRVMTFSRESLGSGERDCPDGTTVGWDAARLAGTATLTTGDACVFFGGCPTAAAIAPRDARTSPKNHTISDAGTLSTLPTPAVALSPANLVWATAMTVVLVLLVAFPTHLLNLAAESATERVAAWRRRVRVPTVTARSGWLVAVAGVVAASVISVFVDPAVGFDGASIRSFLSILLSFVLVEVVAWLLVTLLGRRLPGANPVLRFAPATLLIVLAAVIFTRVTGFQPGIVFGLVAGVTFGAALAATAKARLTLIGLGYSFGIAVIAWIAYGFVDNIFVRETLSATAIAGIAALPIALLPVRGLAGAEVFRWNRVLWAVGYAVGLFGFFVVLMPKPFSWAGVPLSIWTWVGIYLAYALVAVGGWLALTQPWKRSQAESAD